MTKNIKIGFGVLMIIIISAVIFQLLINNDSQNNQPAVSVDNKINNSYVEEYVRENISELSPEKEVLGGKFFVTNLEFPEENVVMVEYEDGHILLNARVVYSIYDDEVTIDEFIILNNNGLNGNEFAPGGKLQAIKCSSEQRNVDFCIEIYQPVCGQVQVECIKAPCDPVKQTFSNSCKACANERVISYVEGACPDDENLNY